LGRFESDIPPAQNALYIGIPNYFGEVGEVFLLCSAKAMLLMSERYAFDERKVPF
jgi:hypothetical protein